MKLQQHTTKKIELVSNIVIVIAVISVGAVFLWNHLLRAKSPAIMRPAIGDHLPLAGLDSYSKIVILAVREGCHYCAESAPFYQKLLNETASNSGIHFVAVLPSGNDKSYPLRLGLPLPDVRLVEFQALKINATPTLLILDHDARVSNVWVGELSLERQAEVLQALGLDQNACIGDACATKSAKPASTSTSP